MPVWKPTRKAAALRVEEHPSLLPVCGKRSNITSSAPRSGRHSPSLSLRPRRLPHSASARPPLRRKEDRPMDPMFQEVLTHLDETLTQISHDLGWFFTLNLGLTALVLVSLVLVWWRLTLSLARMHTETAKTLSDITAIAQAITAQTRELLRRTEP